jgi:type III pantothenate kinase
MPIPPPFLLIDISNSMTKLVPADASALADEPLAIPTAEIDAEALNSLPWDAPDGGFTVFLSSVVPDRDAAVEEAFGKDRVFKVSPELNLGVNIDYPEPDRIGGDRLANAAAAVFFYGAPVVVVDFGTALTFDIVAPGAAYIGGVIAPGLAAMTEYMYDHTALLPRIDLEEPTAAIGKSTESAMRAGAVIGYRGLVKEILGAICAELGGDPPPVVATGGYSKLISEEIPEINIVHQNLTLEGLRIIAGLNTIK